MAPISPVSQDVKSFFERDLKKIVAKTPSNKEYSLTFKENGAKLNYSEISKRYNIAEAKYNDDLNKIWEEVFKGTDYEYR